jgi:hypothetical protein
MCVRSLIALAGTHASLSDVVMGEKKFKGMLVSVRESESAPAREPFDDTDTLAKVSTWS